MLFCCVNLCRRLRFFFRRMDLDVVIHDLAGECEVAEWLNSRKIGVLAEVKADECELGEAS